jgi:hypothetical protein
VHLLDPRAALFLVPALGVGVEAMLGRGREEASRTGIVKAGFPVGHADEERRQDGERSEASHRARIAA